MKLAITKSIELLPQKTPVTRNKRYHLPTMTNNRTQCLLHGQKKMLHFLSLQRSQEDRLENHHALKPVWLIFQKITQNCNR